MTLLTLHVEDERAPREIIGAVRLPCLGIEILAETVRFDERAAALAYPRRLFFESVRGQTFVHEPMRRHPDGAAPKTLRPVRRLLLRRRADAERRAERAFIVKMILHDRLGFFARVETGKQRREMRPCRDSKRHVVVPHRRPVHTVGEEPLAHRAANEVDVFFRKTLTFVVAQEVRNVPESLEVFDQNGIERHVFHPKCFTHAELRIEIAKAVCPQQCLPLPRVHVHIDIRPHVHRRIKTRRVVFAAFIRIDDAREMVIHGVALIDHVFVVGEKLRVDFFQKRPVGRQPLDLPRRIGHHRRLCDGARALQSPAVGVRRPHRLPPENHVRDHAARKLSREECTQFRLCHVGLEVRE